MNRNFITLTLVFFLWGNITAINSTLILFFFNYFHISWEKAIIINAMFYIAPFCTCLPCAALIARLGYRGMLRASLSLAALGCMMVMIALLSDSFILLLLAIFVIATGVAAMQVVANPYLTLLSEPRKRVGNLSLASAVNSLGATLAPIFIALILQYSPVDYFHRHEPIKWLWLALAMFSVLLIISTYLFRLPDVTQPGHSHQRFVDLWQHKTFILSAGAIFVYVGVEVAIATSAMKYLTAIAQWTTDRAAAGVAIYWGGALVGRFLFGLVAHKIRIQFAFLTVTITSALLVLMAIQFNNSVGGYLLLLTGLGNAIIYPVIFGHSINKLPHLANIAAGVLVMAGIGGAVIPYLQAVLIELFSLRISFFLSALLYLLLVLWGAVLMRGKEATA